MTQVKSKIVYTKIDEAPALATYSLLPILKAYSKFANIELETRDISLTGRIIANFPDYLTDDQKINDELAYLGELVKKEEANIIKLPNISASIPQLKAAIEELREKGYNLPDYPEEAKTEEDKKLQTRYAKCLGSAVNPVLREGNSDRRVAKSVKEFAKKNPKALGDWSADSKAHVAHMSGNDFFANEKSVVIENDESLTIEFTDLQGNHKVLKENLKVTKGEVIDGTFLSAAALREFIEKELQDAKEQGLLFSTHLKATMMKVSDPIIFGHFVSVFFKDVFEKHAATFEELGINPNLGLGDLYAKIKKLPQEKQAEIEADIQEVYKNRPALAMVDSDKGITNLHAGNNIIIDASMPVVIRDSGKMWNAEGKLQDTKAVIPDRCYSTFYQEVIEFCKKNGAFNPATMGNVSNVGLMAKKAEEYGSHDKTFEIPADGKVCIKRPNGEVLISHTVQKGDIWRGCQVKDVAIKDWVKLAVNRAKATGSPAVFWLDPARQHDAVLMEKVNEYLKDHDTNGLEIKVLTPVEAVKFSMENVVKGKDVISVTGNVLRDYLTDLFPILELGTSAKMLSIVPLLAGGGLYETGAGGSAPKHVQQFQKEGHLRWDSLGEFLALSVSFEDLGNKTNNDRIKLLATTLDSAIGKFLDNKKSPSRKVNEIDTRGSHFFLAMYWAEALANQTADQEMKERFEKVYKQMSENTDKITQELLDAQGNAVDMGGYYMPNEELVSKAMRPSKTLNAIIDAI